ncbi:MAG: serine/threonine-protein kinase [Nitrospirota bacterium]
MGTLLSRQRLAEWTIGGLLSLLVLVGYFADWPLIHRLDTLTYDLLAPLRAHGQPSDQIVIVGVDDDSLTRIGRWPWPRTTIGELVDILRESGAKVIGLALPLSEPDQSQGLQEIRAIRRELAVQAEALATDLAAAPKPADADLRLQEVYAGLLHDLGEVEIRLDHDTKLAEALARTPQAVLPVAFELGPPLGAETEEPTGPILASATSLVENPGDRLLFPPVEARKLIPPLPAFQHERLASGHLALRPDGDGVLRRDLLLVEYRGRFYPSLALRTVTAFLDQPADQVRVQLGSRVSVGAVPIPTDLSLRLPVSFNGPAGTFKTVPAHAVLTGEALPATFRGKLVLVGLLAGGAADRHATPVAQAVPGVEVVANVAQNILAQNFLSVPDWAPMCELGTLVLVGAFLVAGLPRLTMRLAGLAVLVTLIALAAFASFLYVSSGSVLSVAPAGLLLVAGYLVVGAKRFFLTEQRQELAEADSIETNKMLGLSFQGQGMLDLAFEKFRRCPLDGSVKGLLYNLGLDFERKRMFNKAVAVYEHIQTEDRSYKDVGKRIARLKEVGETLIFGAGGLKKAGPEGTVLVESAGIRPTLGRYEVVKELGRGAMGVVYLGKDPKIQRSVAIKTMRLDEVDQDQVAGVKERFFREAESAGRLSHPNIVTIFDAGEEQELGYIAMEVLDGTDLKDRCRKDNLLPVPQVLELVATVADALDYAHRQGIVHRDIKPANIMLMKDGTVKVTDFGIARIAASSKTQTGVVLGTPSYMSPEQVAGTKVDGRSDLFSLGVVLFELLTGEKPFQAESVATLLFQIANQPHPTPNQVRAELPSCCQAVVDRALQKDAAQRYQRGKDMARDLRACLQTLAG